MIRNGPPYVDLKEVLINGTTLVDCRKELLIPPGTDLCASNNATADQRTEADATAGWTAATSVLASVGAGVVAPVDGSYSMRVTGNGGTGRAQQAITTVDGVHYILRGHLYNPAGNTTRPDFKIGTSANGTQLGQGIVRNVPGAWDGVVVRFVATGTTTYISADGAADGEYFYVDNVSVKVDSPGKYLTAQAFTVVTEFADQAAYLRFTPEHGIEYSLSNAASKAFQADRTYAQSLRFFRASNADDTGFRLILHY